MFDARIRPLIDPALNRIGRTIAHAGVTANQITLAGAIAGCAAGIVIALGLYLPGLALVLVSRLLDGLDGAVARATRTTDFGGYLDITADFLFYGAIPMAFVWADPANNAIAGAFLLTSAGVSLSFDQWIPSADLNVNRPLLVTVPPIALKR